MSNMNVLMSKRHHQLILVFRLIRSIHWCACFMPRPIIITFCLIVARLLLLDCIIAVRSQRSWVADTIREHGVLMPEMKSGLLISHACDKQRVVIRSASQREMNDSQPSDSVILRHARVRRCGRGSRFHSRNTLPKMRSIPAALLAL